MSSSQLTHIFQRGRYTTNQKRLGAYPHFSHLHRKGHRNSPSSIYPQPSESHFFASNLKAINSEPLPAGLSPSSRG